MRPTREQLLAVIAEVKQEAEQSHAHRLAGAVVKLAYVVEALVGDRVDHCPDRVPLARS